MLLDVRSASADPEASGGFTPVRFEGVPPIVDVLKNPHPGTHNLVIIAPPLCTESPAAGE